MNYNFFLKHPENTKVVLLFHGLTGSPFEMKKFGQYLYANGFDVICECLPGHGEDFPNIRSVSYSDWINFAEKTFCRLTEFYNEIYVGGLCLGALLAMHLAKTYSYGVNGVIALSTTMFLDGARRPWYHFLQPICCNSIARYMYDFPEEEPYGIKNRRVRAIIKKLISKNSVGLDNYPMSAVYELTKLAAYIRKNLDLIYSPTLLIHSLEDDFTSSRSSRVVYDNISSDVKELVLLNNSYHMVLYDNEKEFVYAKCLEFLNRCSKFYEVKLCF